MSDWLYEGIPLEEIPENTVGFIYLITNLTNGRQYIGQKVFTSKRVKKPLKGKVNKRRSTVESDWRTYWGSSQELKDDVVKLGESNFKREIILLCESKALMNYEEARLQFEYDVLRYPEKFYNAMINCRISRSQVAKVMGLKRA